MASFEREATFVEHLLARLDLQGASLSNPNSDGSETGMDVLVRLAEDKVVGVQVTELDPNTRRGEARAREKQDAGRDENVYGGWAQNSPSVVLNSLVRTIEGKVRIAARHSFEDVHEVWLLVCCSVPEHGAIISTLLMTPWLTEADIDRATGSLLQTSKYDRCFLFPFVGVVERAFYGWKKNSGWKKSAKVDEACDTSRATYLDSLLQAAATGDWQEIDRLCEEECKNVLSELRRG